MRIHPTASALIASLFVATPALAGTPFHLGSFVFGDDLFDSGFEIDADSDNNLIITGTFQGTIEFGGPVLSSVGSQDIVVAKRSAVFTHVWSTAFGGPGTDAGYGLVVDANDDILLTGEFSDTVNFGGTDLVSAGGTDVFVVKLDENANHIWSIRAGGVGDDRGTSIDVDTAGNVTVTGFYGDTIDFGGGPLTSAGGRDAFLARLDASGAHTWSQAFGGSGDDLASEVAVDALGNAVIAGEFRDTVDFGGGALTSAGDRDIFFAKYDGAGAHVFSQAFGATGDDLATSVGTDAGGNIFLTGGFSGTVSVGGTPLVSFAALDYFLARYDPGGGHVWSLSFGGSVDDVTRAVEVSPINDVVVTGGLNDTGVSEQLFYTRYAADGTEQWTFIFNSSAGRDRGHGIAFDGLGIVAFTGWFEFNLNFGGGPLSSRGARDGFIAKYFDDDPVPVLVHAFEAVPAAGGVELAWRVAATEPLDRFSLRRRRGAGPSTEIAAGDAASTVHLDTGVVAGSTYTYALTVWGSSGEVARSGDVTVTVPNAVAAPRGMPNPFGASTAIAFTIDEPAELSVEIYDAAGRRVRTMHLGTVAPGSHRTTWNGQDDAGRALPSGAYHARVQGTGDGEPVRLVIVR